MEGQGEKQRMEAKTRMATVEAYGMSLSNADVVLHLCSSV